MNKQEIEKRLEKLKEKGVPSNMLNNIRNLETELPEDFHFIVDVQIRQLELFIKWRGEMESKKKGDNN